MKKLITFVLSFLFLLSFIQAAFAIDYKCSAEACILYQPETRTVLYEKNSDKACLIASTTKILTALVVLENADTDSIVEIRPEYTGIEGSSMGLKSGERFTVKELLYGMLLVSGNDAATALSCYVTGSIEGFAELMNDKAEKLGCKNSRFSNPHGLDDENHYSCAYDLAIIMSAAMENKTFAEITGTKSVSLAGRNMTNHNKLLSSCEGVVGGKTGYTKAAGRTLVSYCMRDEMPLVCVTLSDGDDWNDHRMLYDVAYETYSMEEIRHEFEIPLISGKQDTVRLFSEEFYLLYDKDNKPDIVFSVPKFVYAPVEKGDILGVITVDGEIDIPVKAAEDAELNEEIPLKLWEQLKWSWYYYNEHSGCIPFIPRY